MTDTAETPSMPVISEAAIEAAAIALWNRDGGGPDPVPDYVRHDAYATLAAALPHLSIPGAPAPIQDNVTAAASTSAAETRDRGKRMKPKPGAPAGGYPVAAAEPAKAELVRQALIKAKLTSNDGTFVQAPIREIVNVIAALTAADDRVVDQERQIEELRGWDKVWRDRINTAEAEVARLERERDEAREELGRAYAKAGELGAHLFRLQSSQPAGDRPESGEAGRTLLNQEQSNGN